MSYRSVDSKGIIKLSARYSVAAYFNMQIIAFFEETMKNIIKFRRFETWT